jgi:hypothetical protein
MRRAVFSNTTRALSVVIEVIASAVFLGGGCFLIAVSTLA